MGEYTSAAYSGGYRLRRVQPVTVQEFRLRIGAVRQRRRNAWAAYDRYEGLDSGWVASKARELKNDYLTACLEELELVHAVIGEEYVVEMGEVQSREQPCLVQGGGA